MLKRHSVLFFFLQPYRKCLKKDEALNDALHGIAGEAKRPREVALALAAPTRRNGRRQASGNERAVPGGPGRHSGRKRCRQGQFSASDNQPIAGRLDGILLLVHVDADHSGRETAAGDRAIRINRFGSSFPRKRLDKPIYHGIVYLE